MTAGDVISVLDGQSLTHVVLAHGSQREEEELSVETPLGARRAGQFGQGVQEEGDSLVHLVHAHPAQHLLQEGKREGVVVPPPAVHPHGGATWWRRNPGSGLSA